MWAAERCWQWIVPWAICTAPQDSVKGPGIPWCPVQNCEIGHAVQNCWTWPWFTDPQMSRKEEDWLSSSLSLCHRNGYFPSTNKLQPSFSSLCPYSHHFPHSSSHLFPGFWESPTVLLPEPTHSFKKHLLSAWYVPGTVLSVQDEVVNKAKSLPPGAYILPGGGGDRE